MGWIIFDVAVMMDMRHCQGTMLFRIEHLISSAILSSAGSIAEHLQKFKTAGHQKLPC